MQILRRLSDAQGRGGGSGGGTSAVATMPSAAVATAAAATVAATAIGGGGAGGAASGVGTAGAGGAAASAASAGGTSASGSGQKGKSDRRVFEQPLHVGAEHDMYIDALSGRRVPLPSIFVKSIIYLEERGLDVEGIFRVPGSVARMKELRAMFDRGVSGASVFWAHGCVALRPVLITRCGVYGAGDDVKLSGESDANVVAGLLKLYLRELPDGIIVPTSAMQGLENAMSAPRRPSYAWRTVQRYVRLTP